MSPDPGFQPEAAPVGTVPPAPRPSIPPEGLPIVTATSGALAEPPPLPTSILDPEIYVDMPWKEKLQLLKAVLGVDGVPPDVSRMTARMQAQVMAAWMLGQGLQRLDTPQFVQQPRVFRRTTEGAITAVTVSPEGTSCVVRTRNAEVPLPAKILPSEGVGLRLGHPVRIVVEIIAE